MTKKEPEQVTAWITKYALTSGIVVATGEVNHERPSMLTTNRVDGDLCSSHYHGLDWHRTEADAIERAEVMRDQKIVNLEKQIARLKALDLSKEKKDV